MSSKEYTINIKPTHSLKKKAATVRDPREGHNENQVNSLPSRKGTKVCVTREGHNKNKTNSLSSRKGHGVCHQRRA